MSADQQRLQAALAGRQAHADRLRSFQGQLTEVVGRIDIIGAGEATVDVNFPVQFIEHPSFTFGGEMQENSAVQTGSYPTISVMVLRWETAEAEPGAGQDHQYFVGATLVTVTTGLPNQRQRAHFSVKGLAIVNPKTGAV